MSTSNTPPIPTPFNPRDFLRLARELSQRPSDEASLRSSISRAYYAAFWIARDFIKRKSGIALKRHDKTWETLKKDPSHWTAGEDGRVLLRQRQLADYEEHVPDLAWQAEKAIARADKIIKRLAPKP
jgi:uncharacterized protein (UPF0332 family)